MFFRLTAQQHVLKVKLWPSLYPYRPVEIRKTEALVQFFELFNTDSYIFWLSLLNQS